MKFSRNILWALVIVASVSFGIYFFSYNADTHVFAQNLNTLKLTSGLTQFTQDAKSNELMLAFASNSFGSAGSVLTLTGTGFSAKSNTVNFGKEKIKNISSADLGTLTFTIPSGVKAGRYEISVTNGKKTSNTIPFMVSVKGAQIPIITKIEPAIATFGQKITITGENFSSAGNTVSSSLGIIKDLKSVDGKTLTFSVEKPEYLKEKLVLPAWFKDKGNLNWSVTLFIINENGISKDGDQARFIMNI